MKVRFINQQCASDYGYTLDDVVEVVEKKTLSGKQWDGQDVDIDTYTIPVRSGYSPVVSEFEVEEVEEDEDAPMWDELPAGPDNPERPY